MSRIAFIIGFVMLPALASAQSAQDRKFTADVDALVHRVMALQPAPGIAVAVVKGDRTILAKGYGYADVERTQPVTENTGFYIASTTKAFTALDIALMAKRGVISLDDPVSKYLGGVQWASGVNADSITIRQLLTHTHGIENSGPVVWRTAFSGVHTNALLKDLLRYHPVSDAGRSYRYTNLGYNIAGLIIDELTHSRWQDELGKNIFTPLGMTNTSAYVSRFDSAGLAMPYADEPAGRRRLHYAKGDGNMQAAGGLVSTAADMTKWLRAQINLGRVDGKQIFPRDVVAETHRAQAMFKETGSAGFGYALGWNAAVVHGDTVLHHGGGFSAFRTYIAFSPNSKIGVAVMTNEASVGGAAVDFIIDQVLDHDREPAGWQARTDEELKSLVSRLQTGRERIAADRARRATRSQTLPNPLDTYTGTFENAEAGTMTWTVRDGKLWAEIGLLKSVAEVFDDATNKLRVELEPAVGSVVAFEIGDGKAKRITFSGRTYVRKE